MLSHILNLLNHEKHIFLFSDTLKSLKGKKKKKASELHILVNSLVVMEINILSQKIQFLR